MTACSTSPLTRNFFLTILYFFGVIFSWQKKPLHGPESFSPSLNGQTALLDNGPPTWDLLP